MKRKWQQQWARPDRWLYLCAILLAGLLRVLRRKPRSIRSILVIQQLGIGDMVYALPTLTALHVAQPRAQITVWCQHVPGQLLAHDPAVFRIVHNAAQLEPHYDMVADLGSTWAAQRWLWAHWPRRLYTKGWVRLRNKLRDQHPHTVAASLQVVTPVARAAHERPPIRIHYDEQAKRHVRHYLVQLGITRYAVLHVGAPAALRRWPAARYVELAQKLKQWYQLDIIFCGGQEDKKLIESIRLELPFATYHACALFHLAQLACLLAGAALFVGNESGPLHMAAAVGAPALGLFGPGEPHVFYPYAPRSSVLHTVLPCCPCDQVHCVQPEHPCMQHIHTKAVLEQVHGLLQ